jgi:putative adenylate-forming enzyme
MRDKLSILGHYLNAKYLRRFPDRAALEAHQRRQLARFKTEVLQHLPFFANLWEKDLSSFPLTDKAIVQQNFADLNSLALPYDVGLPLAQTREKVDGITVGLSSGTSGRRGLFLVSEDERHFWLGVMLAKALPGPLWQKHRVVLALSANSDLYTTANKNSRMRFHFLDLKAAYQDHLHTLTHVQPTILIAPAQFLKKLAQSVQAGDLQINPARIFSVGEVLSDEDRTFIGDQFHQPIHQIYQCTEGFLGITCAHGTLHLNEEYVHVEKEWLDEDKTRFNPIITDFSRTTQAIVRYRMNDILKVRQTPCACGSPLLAIETVEGRCDDILKLPHTDQTTSVDFYPDDIRALILDADPSIQDFRVHQPDVDQLRLRIDSPSPAAKDKVTHALLHAIHARNAQPPTLTFDDWPPAVDLSQKLRRIVRDC